MAESKDRNRPLVMFALAIFVIAALLVGCGSGLSNAPVLQSKVTPSPEVSSGEMLRQLRATEDAALNTYGWVDRKNGKVHIPIERAMQLLLQRGLPIRPADQQPIQEF